MKGFGAMRTIINSQGATKALNRQKVSPELDLIVLVIYMYTIYTL